MCIIILLRLKLVYSILSFALTLIIFNFKKDSYDLITYKNSPINTDYEYLFVLLINFFNLFTNDLKLLITYFQIFILILSSSIIFFFRNNKILILAVIFSSVAVNLAVHNNLRQGTSCLLILIAIIFILRENKFLFLLFATLSIGFHLSAILFLFCILTAYLFYSSFLSKPFKKKYFSMYSIYITSFLIGFIFSVFLYLLLNLDLLLYSQYYEMILTIKNERTPLPIKALALFALSFVSELSLNFKRIDAKIDFFRLLRLLFLFFILFISFDKNLDEIGARILYFYYIAELYILCHLLSKKLYFSSCVIILFYSAAINVWNILGR
jgi:hypothetical protein